MPKIYIDAKLVSFPESCLAKQPAVAFREKKMLEVALRYPPIGERGFNRYDAITADMHTLGFVDETPSSVRSVLTRIRTRVRRYQAHEIAATVRAEELVNDPERPSADLSFKNLINFIDVRDPQPARKTATRQVIVLADLHGYPNKFLLPAIQEAVDPDKELHFIYAGDLYDLFCSSGVGMKDGVPLRLAENGEQRFLSETAALTGFMRALHEKFPGSIHHILRGNHDEIIKVFDRVPFWVLRRLVKDPLQELADLFPNTTVDGWNVRLVESTGEVKENYKHVPYAVVFGSDLFISHLNKTGGKPFKSVTQTWEWIQDKRLLHDLGGIRVVLQAHSHKLSSQDFQGGHVRLVEIGFGGEMEVLRYQVGYNIWSSETSVGCVMLEQNEVSEDRWVTDRLSVRHLRP